MECISVVHKVEARASFNEKRFCVVVYSEMEPKPQR